MSTLAGWWQRRAPRERAVLLAGAAVLVLALGWAFLWLPAQQAETALQARIQAQLATLEDLAALRQARTRSTTMPRAADATGSVASRADRGLRMAGLAASIRRIEPVGESAVQVTLEQAPFDDLADWLPLAAAEHALTVEQMQADAASAPGEVNLRMRLADAASR